ncbi:hypothetical protein BDP67DRAFT_529213 [Colletotrichum lupini]|nr:hypothetical protein BDP67DRAFT_529213 [Colletotrichum lupini]
MTCLLGLYLSLLLSPTSIVPVAISLEHHYVRGNRHRAGTLCHKASALLSQLRESDNRLSTLVLLSRQTLHFTQSGRQTNYCKLFIVLLSGSYGVKVPEADQGARISLTLSLPLPRDYSS